MRRLALLLMALVVLGCSTRDHENPLDPENPATDGRPQWLTVLADHEAVDLRWSVPRFDDVQEILLRDGKGVHIDFSLPGRSGTLRMPFLTNGVVVSYRLDLALTTGGVIELPWIHAEPGPAIPWVLDSGSGQVSRLPPDARAIRFSLPIRDPRALRIDPDSAHALVVDFFGGEVMLFDRLGVERWRTDAVAHPRSAARGSGGWWVADPVENIVGFLDANGELLHTDTSLVTPLQVVDGGADRVWAAQEFNTVALLTRGAGETARLDSIGFPGGISADGAGGVWVADLFSDELIHADAKGKVLLRLGGYPGIVGIARDPVLAGGVWLCDRARGRVILMDDRGTESIVLETVSPSTAAVAPDGSEIWVADPGASAVLRFDRAGRLVSRVDALSSPVTIAVAFNPVR